MFSDATGVVKGDDVRIAGVKVGEVEDIEIVDAHRGPMVTFTVDADQPADRQHPRARSATATWSASATSR